MSNPSQAHLEAHLGIQPNLTSEEMGLAFAAAMEASHPLALVEFRAAFASQVVSSAALLDWLAGSWGRRLKSHNFLKAWVPAPIAALPVAAVRMTTRGASRVTPATTRPPSALSVLPAAPDSSALLVSVVSASASAPVSALVHASSSPVVAPNHDVIEVDLAR
jgi:hypothetical protein